MAFEFAKRLAGTADQGNDMQRFPCWIVEQQGDGPAARAAEIGLEDLPTYAGPCVWIEVAYSSLNYKDALASKGHRGVAGDLPHVPGVDCAGSVLKSDSPDFMPGDEVLVTGYELGAPRWGGFSGVVCVPADWPVPLRGRLSARDAMVYGTAGFTAAQCVHAVQQRVATDQGDVLVTGSTGGVGVFAVALLAKLGYRVVAVTGKAHLTERLLSLGAAEVVSREELDGPIDKPLLSERWAAAVDTVGGAPLASIVRSLQHRGVVAACGLVAGTDLPLSVYPFLLRGVTLAGIDSAKCPRQPRLEIWDKLAGPWRVELPEELVTTVGFDTLPEAIDRILAGGVAGRTLVRPVVKAV